MNEGFFNKLGVVTAGHFVALAALVLVPMIAGLFQSKPRVIYPVVFEVAGPGEKSIVDDVKSIINQGQRRAARQEELIRKKAEKEAKAAALLREKDKKEKEKQKEKNKPTPRSSANPVDKPMSAKEIERLLKMGATLGTRNIIPSEEIQCQEYIRKVMYDAWEQPSYDEVGSAVAQVEFRIEKNGIIFGWRMVKRSGNDIMDASVMQAARSVKRFDELTSEFIANNDKVTVSFQVEPE